MVLIIRNNRILSSRQSRIKKLLSRVHKDPQKLCHKKVTFDNNKEASIMGLVAVLGTLFLYSIAMFTLPFVAFYGVQHFIKAEFKTDIFITNCFSVLAAVITVNLIISCYAYQALHEPDDASESKEDADQPANESVMKKIE